MSHHKPLVCNAQITSLIKLFCYYFFHCFLLIVRFLFHFDSFFFVCGIFLCSNAHSTREIINIRLINGNCRNLNFPVDRIAYFVLYSFVSFVWFYAEVFFLYSCCVYVTAIHSIFLLFNVRTNFDLFLKYKFPTRRMGAR